MKKKIKKKDIGPFSSSYEKENAKKLLKLFKNIKFDDEFTSFLPLFTNRQLLSRILFMHEIYKKTIGTEGHIFEFGCKWGSNLSIFTALRGIYEPFNHNKKIYGFDTFAGIKGTSLKDRDSIAGDKSYSTSPNWDNKLREILTIQESFCPIPHIKKHEIIKGDVRVTLKKVLQNKKHLIASLIYLDMDIYSPTKYVLSKMLPHVTKGTIIVFDESNWDAFPGPTLALNEVFGKRKYKIQKSIYQPIPSYIEIT